MMDQPSATEILTAVREFIEKHAMPELTGRTAFHARVAANAIAIIVRELDQGDRANVEAQLRLEQLLQRKGSILELNRVLCRRLRTNELAIDDAGLSEHLMLTTLAKVAIDQPNYSGLLHSPHRRTD